MGLAASAPRLAASGGTIHLRCGDDILGKLARAGLPGQYRRWADALCQGPTPAGLSYDAWIALRAAFLAEAYGLTADAATEHLASDDAGLELCRAAEEIVLWLEHDLYDQIVLVHLLDRLARMGVPRERLALICIGSHPDVQRFIGLGQLDAAQLAALFPRRRAVGEAEVGLARRAWRAWTAPDPLPLLALLEADTSRLPFLGPALRRHLQEYPDRRSGLGLTERLALEAVRDGAGTGAAIFGAVQARETAPWMGDTMLYAVLKRLASGDAPLLASAGPEGWPPHGMNLARRRFDLTELGRRALAGEVDWIALAGIDRWLAGVHLAGRSPAWRWDEDAGTLVAAA